MEPDLNDAPEPTRFFSALQAAVETRSTEFKESQPYDVLQWKLVKSCMAMANLRDGGMIIIGVDQRSGPPTATGMETAHAASYDQDKLIALVNTYSRPPISLTLKIETWNTKHFVAIEVAGFSRSPVMCWKATPQSAGKEQLNAGDICARSLDRVATSRIVDAELLADLLEIAAEKRAGEIIAMARRIGLSMPNSAVDRFTEERRSFGPDDLWPS